MNAPSELGAFSIRPKDGVLFCHDCLTRSHNYEPQGRSLIKVELEVVPHPYLLVEPGMWEHEAWGQFRLSIGGSRLIDQQWDLCPFLEWLLASRDAILKEELRIDGVGPSVGETLAGFLSRAPEFGDDADDPDDTTDVERIMDLIWAYRDRHCLHTAFRGTDVRAWVVGLNNGEAEMSINGDEPQSFRFSTSDLSAFVDDLTTRGIVFLREWLDRPQPAEGVRRVRAVLARLEMPRVATQD